MGVSTNIIFVHTLDNLVHVATESVEVTDAKGW